MLTMEGGLMYLDPPRQKGREEALESRGLLRNEDHSLSLQVLPLKILQGEELRASFQDLRSAGALSGRSSTTTSIMSPTSNVLR